MWDAKGRGSADAEFEVAASEAERQASKVQLGGVPRQEASRECRRLPGFRRPMGLGNLASLSGHNR